MARHRSGPWIRYRHATGTASAKSHPMTLLHQKRTGLDRMRRAVSHSIAGLRGAYREESAFRQEFWAAVAMGPAAFWIGRNWFEVAALIGTVVLVLIVELLNSAVEAAIDRISLDVHDLSRHAKDVSSAAVFLAVLLCGEVWLSALWAHAAA